jgi:hypothetical protein
METPAVVNNSPFRIRQRILAPVARWVGLGVLSVAISGCGGAGSFEKSLDQMWQWDGGVEASRIMTALQSKKSPESVPAAVGVTGRGLVGRTLPAGKLWKYEGPVDVLPTLVADVVIFSGNGRATMIDVRTGVTKFSIDVSGRRLEGAGYDGENAVLLLVDSNDARQDQILVVGSNGDRRHSVMATARIGTPAAIGGVGLVPYSGQYVGAFDLESGDHLGRILLRDGIHTATTEAGNVLLLGAGATLIDEQITSSPESRSLKLEPREFPGEPDWPLDGSKPRTSRTTPVGIYAYPEKKEGRLSFAHGAYLSTYFEVIVGVDQGTNKIRFANHFPRAVAGGAVGSSAGTVCLENGSLWRVNMRDGATAPFGSLESRVRGCVVSGSGGAAPQEERPPLLEQIVATISETGPDMVSMQHLLLAELSKSSGSETTQALLEVAQNPLVSVDLSRKAAELLSEREEGGPEMVDALRRSAPQSVTPKVKKEPSVQPKDDVVKDKDKDKQETKPASTDDTWSDEGETGTPTSGAQEPQPQETALAPGVVRRENRRPPPVGALAAALTRLKTPGAAEALAPFLSEPSLSPKDARSLLIAIRRLGGPNQVPEVQAFFDAYKNTGGEPALVDALVIAAEFLDKHLNQAGREELRRAAGQSLTHPVLRQRLEKKLKPLAPASDADKKSGSIGAAPSSGNK